MGFDTYMDWKDQTEEEKEAQYVGGSINFGHVGYLRGGPALDLTGGAWQDGKAIPASELRARLPEAIAAAQRRYGCGEITDMHCRSLNAFVQLAERKEAETGEPVVITTM